MPKITKKALSILLTLLLVLPLLPLSVQAEETLSITSEEEFLSFAEHCRLDSYSQNLTVRLEADLDLRDTNFDGVPIFSGTFEGNGHTIRGLSITSSGSVQGLFRYLTDTAKVEDLHIQGHVLPQGSQEDIGALAGSNAGTITGCSFDGDIAGTNRVGGLVGTNQVSGIVEQCHTSGSVQGSHYVGGIAGQNYGTVRNCTNTAQINVTANQNNIDLADMTIDTLRNSESVKSVTDIGGICGGSTGVIHTCENRADIGYRHMGYNIGGIAGSQMGYIADSTNYGTIYGRKEVGGIVGQMEPVSRIEYSADTLQILQQQLSDTAALADQAGAHAHANATQLNGHISALQSQAEVAKDAVTGLLPDPDDPQLPDSDSLQAAKNTLNSSMTSMENTMQDIISSKQEASDTMTDDLRGITNQLNAIGNTLGSSSANMGGSITDISDEDTSEDRSGKTVGCSNYGSVSGDLNTGGIVGAMAWENDLDPEDDLQRIGNRSLNFSGELRAVVRECENRADVSVKKRCSGGIVGLMTLGLVADCNSNATLLGDGADSIGGIAGSSSAYIRRCSAKSRLSGDTSVGGIAGSGATVTDCRSIAAITEGTEKLGAILGSTAINSTEKETTVSGNFYLPIGTDLGAMDGISYAGSAEPLALEDFLALENLPEDFHTSQLTFLYEDGTSEVRTIPLGGALAAEDIPAVSEKEGSNSAWAGLEDMDLTAIYFDETFSPDYAAYVTTARSVQQRDNGKAILLALGHFPQGDSFDLEAIEDIPALPARHSAVECWQFPAVSQEETELRFSLPEGLRPSRIALQMRSSDGTWRSVSYTVNGSYLILSAQPGDDALCLSASSGSDSWSIYFLGALLVVGTTVGVVSYHKHRKKKKVASTVS